MSKIDMSQFIPPEILLQQLPGIFTIKDLELNYCAANLEAAKILGFSSTKDVVGLKSYSILNTLISYSNKFLENDREILNTGKAIQAFGIYQFAKESPKMFFGLKKPLLDHNQKICGIMCHATELPTQYLFDFLQKIQSFNANFDPKELARIYHFDLKGKADFLTKRELEILFHLTYGKTAKEIAKCIGISFRTVEFHINSLKNKFSCHNKKDIVEKAIGDGIINIISRSVFMHDFYYKAGSIR